MSKISEYFQIKGSQYGGNIKLLVFAGLGFTVSMYLFTKSVYKPWARRRKLDEAERYANYVYDQEKGNNK